MGSFQSFCSSLQRSTVQEVNIDGNTAYRYPPKSGCYFGNHFTMGGQRFDTPQPEAYLFGENSDLNYLGSRPAAFPYPASSANEPTKTLKSLVNIRKDSLRLVKVMKDTDSEESNDNEPEDFYSIEFTFDSEARSAITIYFFATEDIDHGKAKYTARHPTLRSETFHYERGPNQQFYQPAFTFSPATFNEEEFSYDPLKEVIPIVIQCTIEEGEEHTGHCHTLLATFEQTSEGTYVIKYLKQKQMVDGVYYLLQEIYGIENKNMQPAPKTDEEDLLDDNGSDCAICLSEPRDTLILPCRHLCLCNSCADNLRYQASSCPICRAPFRALLQIRALRKVTSPADNQTADESVSQENVPPGYQAIPLGEALNGPSQGPVMGAEGGSTVDRSERGAGEGRSKKKRKSRTNSANTNRSRHSETDVKKAEAKKPNKNDSPIPVDVVSGAVLKVTDVTPADMDEKASEVTENICDESTPHIKEQDPTTTPKEPPAKCEAELDLPPVYETQIEIGHDPLEVDYLKEKFESDTQSTASPLMMPPAVFMEESEGLDRVDDLDLNASANSSTMTTVDVDLPGTPVGVANGQGTFVSVTPTNIDVESNSAMIL